MNASKKLYYVAYFDILGFKNKVKDNDENIVNIFDRIKKLRKFNNENTNKKIINFSDSVFLFYDFFKCTIDQILNDVYQIQSDLLSFDTIIRGGIGIGEVSIYDETFFCGNIINEVVEMEKKEEPCVFLTYNFFTEYIKNYNENNISVYASVKDNIKDALLYLDNNNSFYYIKHINPVFNYNVNELENLKKIIDNGIKNYDDKIRKKYIFLKTTYDKYIR